MTQSTQEYKHVHLDVSREHLFKKHFPSTATAFPSAAYLASSSSARAIIGASVGNIIDADISDVARIFLILFALLLPLPTTMLSTLSKESTDEASALNGAIRKGARVPDTETPKWYLLPLEETALAADNIAKHATTANKHSIAYPPLNVWKTQTSRLLNVVFRRGRNPCIHRIFQIYKGYASGRFARLKWDRPSSLRHSCLGTELK